MGPTPRIPPPAERDDVVEELHGRLIADPYRYLEDPAAARTRAFVAAQNACSEPYLEQLPARRIFAGLTTGILTAPRTGVPWERGGRYFAFENSGELDQDQLFVADSLAELRAGGRLLIDPNTWSTDGTVAIMSLAADDQGRRLAYTRSEAGSDWTTVEVIDIESGELLPDRLVWTKFTQPLWLPDNSSFLYWSFPPPVSAQDTGALGAGRLMLHRLGDQQEADQLVWERPADENWGVDPWVSSDGSWLVLTAAPGTSSRSTVSARRLSLDAAGRSLIEESEVVVVGELADAHHPVATAGDLLYLRTERDAPTGRLVTVDLTDPAAAWTTVVAGDAERVLTTAARTAAGFALLWSVDAAHRVQIVSATGDLLAEPDLGEAVSVVALHCRSVSSEIFVGTSSFVHRLAAYRIDTAGERITLTELPGPAGGPALPPAVAVRRRAGSTDGAQVPMTMVRRSDLPAGPRPVLLYGYGGFDIPVLPTFSAMFASWVAAGGVLVVANLRGGGEFGADWHEQGMLHRKQQVFDDLFACADSLISDGLTTPGQLALFGRSNGGLLVGAAMTQRPELFAAALPTVGVLDMLRYHLFTIGRAWTVEYGTPDDAADFEVLSGYSPLHRLRPGTHYPATLICTGDHDDRVVPAHSLKFGAELQRCQGGSAPVLLRVDTRAGHGAGKPVTALAAEYADQLAFAAQHSGLEPMSD